MNTDIHSKEWMNAICTHVRMSSGFIISERNVWGRKRSSKNLLSPFSLSADQVAFCQSISKDISLLLEIIALQILFLSQSRLALRILVPLSAASNFFLHIFYTTLSCQWHWRQHNQFGQSHPAWLIACNGAAIVKSRMCSTKRHRAMDNTFTAYAVPQYYQQQYLTQSS